MKIVAAKIVPTRYDIYNLLGSKMKFQEIYIPSKIRIEWKITVEQ